MPDPRPQYANPDFDTWLRLVFDPPANENSLDDWHWHVPVDAPPDDGPLYLVAAEPVLFTSHLLRLLEEPGKHLAMHHDNQVASGLEYLFNSACGGDVRDLAEPSVAHQDRLEVMGRIDRLYSELVVPRSPEALGHLSEDGGRLAGWAYMFWDVCALVPPADPKEADDYRAAQIDAMGRILALPHAAAQEGALHGLGHDNSLRAVEVIDRWLAEGTPARPELVAYARSARSGCIL